MEKYVCTNCGYIYDPVKGEPSRGYKPGIAFPDLPEDYFCPVCYAQKKAFDPL